jgi:transcriptional regulator with XRE-family HTH domain
MSMESLKQTIAQNIRDFRSAKNISAAEMGRKLGVSQSTVSDWETGKKMPRAEVIEKIADYFGIMRTEILTSRDERVRQAKKPAEYEVIDLDYLLSSSVKVVASGKLLTSDEKDMAARIIKAAFSGGNR